jgi:glycine cleavage system H protein
MVALCRPFAEAQSARTAGTPLVPRRSITIGLRECRAMELPAELKYATSHEWINDHGDGTASVGITAIAAEQLGDLVYVELPEVGRMLARGEACAVVESSKAASDVYVPAAGEVLAVNEALAAHPENVNRSPYADGWLFKLKLARPIEGLLSRDEYGQTAGSQT